MSFPYEPIGIARTSATLQGLIDPKERRIYFDGDTTDVQVNDIAGMRGYTRRIIAQPQVWSGAGVVAEFEDAPAALPDLGALYRASGAKPVLNETTGAYDPPAAGTPFWSGACLVEPTESDGSSPEIGDQQVGVVPFVVTVPLALEDVRVGDLFKVTQSRDGRLLVRLLVVKAVRASSTALTRELLAFDNQGG